MESGIKILVAMADFQVVDCTYGWSNISCNVMENRCFMRIKVTTVTFKAKSHKAFHALSEIFEDLQPYSH